MKKSLLLLIPLFVILGAGCSNEQELLIQQQQKQIEELSKKIDKVSQNNQKIETQQKTIISQSAKQTQDNSFYRKYITTVVQLYCPNQEDGIPVQGSGVIVKDKTAGKFMVYTNAHVLGSPTQFDKQTGNTWCIVYTIKNEQDQVVIGNGLTFTALPVVVDQIKDLAKLEITNIFRDNQLPVPVTAADIKDLVAAPPTCAKNDIHIGDKLYVLGYPDVGGDTITITDGIISGFEKGYQVNYIATSAKISHGNSGGLALHQSGCSLGIPTQVKIGEMESMGYIIDLTK